MFTSNKTLKYHSMYNAMETVKVSQYDNMWAA
jgi:hypothetical protein